MKPTAKLQTKKRFVIYTRCSTDDQAQGDFTTLDAQAHHCKNMLDALGYELADFGKKGIVADDGYSGKDLNRPGIQSILNSVNKNKQFDGVIFFRLDRLTRNPRDLYGLIDLFKENDIDFISVRENLDSSSALGRVVIGIIGLLSAFERELTGERVKASGIARARQGKWIGGALPFGYKLVNHGDPLPNGRQPHKIVIDPEMGPKIRQIWQMAAENNSLRTIAKELVRQGIKSPKGKTIWKQTILRTIKNRFYLGFVTWSGETHKGEHDPLIDKPTWEKANKMISASLPGHRFLPKPKAYVYLLERLLRCGSCGSHLITTHAMGRTNKFHYYTCSRMKQGLGCTMPRINAQTMDNALVEYFQRSSKDRELIIQAIEDAVKDARSKLLGADKEIALAEKKLENHKEEAEKLLDLALKGEISKGAIYKDRMEKLDQEIETLQNELSKLQARRKVAEISANSGDFIHSNITYAMEEFNDAAPEAQKALFNALIKEIIVHEDRLEIKMLIGQPLEQSLDQQKNAQTNQTANSGLPERNEWRPQRDSNPCHHRERVMS